MLGVEDNSLRGRLRLELVYIPRCFHLSRHNPPCMPPPLRARAQVRWLSCCCCCFFSFAISLYLFVRLHPINPPSFIYGRNKREAYFNVFPVPAVACFLDSNNSFTLFLSILLFTRIQGQNQLCWWGLKEAKLLEQFRLSNQEREQNRSILWGEKLFQSCIMLFFFFFRMYDFPSHLFPPGTIFLWPARRRRKAAVSNLFVSL
jgi:hypothetical protein